MQKNNLIQLSDHFTYGRLIRFTIAPIMTMIFTSVYGIVDGFFVSNYVGSLAFASLNLVFPFLMMISAIGFMFGAGGTALVSMQLGSGEEKKARESFSLLVYTVIVLGVALSCAGYYFAPNVSRLLGADDAMLPYCVLYLRINLFGIVFFMLQNMFQTFLIAAEQPKLGFFVTLLAGCTNMFLDWLLVGELRLGLAGAAWATVTSQMIGGIVPLFYFISPWAKQIRLGKTAFHLQVLLRSAGNGISEFLSNVSASIVGMLNNLQLLRYAGENGVSAYGVIMYVTFIFVAIFVGYSMGVAPVIGFHYGAENKPELKSLLKKSLLIILIANLLMTGIAELSATVLVKLFVGYDAALYALTVKGMQIYGIAFLVLGFNIFASSFFTALNNGVVSGILSVCRTLIFQLVMIYLLPYLFGTDGLWAVVIAVEGFGFLLSVIFLLGNRKKYGYL